MSSLSELLAAAQAPNATASAMLIAANAFRVAQLETATFDVLSNLETNGTLLTAAAGATSTPTAVAILNSKVTYLAAVRVQLAMQKPLHRTLATGGTAIPPTFPVASSITALQSAKGEIELGGNALAQTALPLIEALLALASTATNWSLHVTAPFLVIAALDNSLTASLASRRRTELTLRWAWAQQRKLEGTL